MVAGRSTLSPEPQTLLFNAYTHLGVPEPRFGEFGLQFHFMFFAIRTDRRWLCVEFPLALSPCSSVTRIQV
jgi:hypothetical protein